MLFDDAVVMLEERVMLDAVPTATFTAATQTVPLKNPDGSFTAHVVFDNTSATDTGYGPFIQLIVPTLGRDGPAAGAPTGDGIKFTDATYLNQNLGASNIFDLTFQSVGGDIQATNPLTNQVVHATDYNTAGYTVQAGDHLVVLRLPFGSFTPPQTPADIAVNFTLSSYADLGTALPIQATGGFQFGNSSVGTTPILQPAASVSIDQVTPTLITLSKTSDTESNTSEEVATGPNQAFTYTLHLDVADGQTLNNINITDLLPDSVVYQGVTAVRIGGATATAGAGAGHYSITAQPTLGSVVDPAHNALTVHVDTLTGPVGVTSDVEVDIRVYVTDLKFDGSHVLTVGSNYATTQTGNNVSAGYTWVPLDIRDGLGTPATLDPAGFENVIQNRPIAIQKSGTLAIDADGTGNLSAGDTILYTLNVQVSDYYSLGDITINDVLSDGQRLDTSTLPTISLVQRGGAAQAGNLAGVTPAAGEFTGNFASSFSGTTGLTTSTINVSAALIAAGFDLDGILAGGRTLAADTAANTGGTTFTITFRAIVQNNFVNPTPGNASVDQGDSVGNTATISSSVRDNLAPLVTTLGATALRDDSAASLAIVTGGLTKTIYAINGSTDLSTVPVDGTKLLIKAGDTITYRLTYNLPISSFENLTLTDYLPLPVLPSSALTLDSDVFVPTGGTANLPESGEYARGQLDTYSNLPNPNSVMVTFSPSNAGNSITFNFGSYSLQDQGQQNRQSTIDLLFTLTVADTPFADGLFLTNLASSSENNTTGNATRLNAINQFELSQPRLIIQKAYVGSTNANGVVVQGTGGTALTNVDFNTGTTSGITFTGGRTSLTDTDLGTATVNAVAAAPNLNSDITKLDGGDTARVAIVVNNEGSSATGAFDVTFGDTLATGTAFFGGTIGTAHLVLTRGDGTVLNPATDYTVMAGATSFTVTLTNGLVGAGNGAIAQDDTSTGVAATGKDILIATYDITIDNNIALPSPPITSPATLTHFSAFAGGVDIANPDLSESASIAFDSPTVTKVLQVPGTEPSTGAELLTIGESSVYRVTYNIPDGTFGNVKLLDFLPTTYNITGASLVSASTGISVGGTAITDNASLTATFGGFVSYQTGGQTYGGFTGNGASNGTGVSLLADGGTAGAKTIVIDYTVQAANLTTVANANNTNTGDFHYAATDATGTAAVGIAIPVLQVTKTLVNSGPVDAGDTILFDITVAHAGTSRANAYDLLLSDMLPTGLTGLAIISVTPGTTGLTTANFRTDGTTLTFSDGSGGTPDTQGTFDLAIGQTFTVRISAVLSASAQAGGTYTNMAGVTYSTLPDATAHTPIAGEKTDLTASGSASVTVPILLSKSFDAAGLITANQSSIIGGTDTITYYITATLPEGVSNNLRIMDNLNSLTPNLVLDSATIFSVGGNIFPGGTIVGTPVVGSASIDLLTNTATFNFGNLQDNIDGAAQNSADKIIVKITAHVKDPLNSGSPTRGDILQNVSTEKTDLIDPVTMMTTSTITGSSNMIGVQIADPSMTITKQVQTSPGMFGATTTTGASGDIVQFKSVISALSGTNISNAEDVVFTDILGDGATLSGGSVSIDGVTVAVGGTTVIGGVTVSVDSANGGVGFSIRFGEVVAGTGHTIIYNAAINSAGGSTVGDDANLGKATVTYDAISHTTGGVAQTGVGDGQNDHDQSASASATVGTVSFTKAFVATTAGANGGNTDTDTGTGGAGDKVRSGIQDLAIGETVDLQFVVTVPAGARTLSISDLLAVANADPTLAGRLTYDSVVATTPSAGVVLTAAPSITTPDANHAAVSFTTTGGSTAGTVTITLRTHVTDTAVNAGGDKLDLPAVLTYSAAPPSGVVGTIGATASVDLVEPTLAIVKGVVAGTPNAGDTVSYTVTVTNTGTAAAYDVLIADPAPAGLTYGTATLVIGGTTTNPASAASVSIPTLLAGQTATLTYTATVGASVVTGSTVNNTATLTSTTMPGVVATERAEPTLTSSASFVTEATQAFAKTISATSDANTGTAAYRAGIPDLTIGEVATIDLQVNLSEGTTNSVVISDFLTSAAGTLTYVPGSAVLQTANGATITGTVTPTLVDDNADGVPDRVVFTLGNVTVPGDNVAGNNFIVVRYQASPGNRPENATGDAIDLTATLTTALGTLTDAKGVDLVEPLLVIDKQIMTSDPTPNAGDTVTYKVIVTNNGTGPAYAVNISDPLPAGLTYSGAPSLVVAGVTSTPPSAAAVTVAMLLPGQSATLTYSATIDNSAVTGVPINNTATIASSGTTPGGGGRPGPTPSDSTSFTVEALQGLDKAISATSDPNTGTGAYRAGVPDVHVGETATVDLTVRLTEGTTGSVVLVDKLQLPAGTLTLTAPPTIITANGITFTGTGAAGYTLTDTNGDGVPDTITMNFGTVTVPGNNDPSDNFFVIRYTGVVGDRPENQAGNKIDLAATLTTALGTAGAATQIDVVAPAVTLSKSAAAGFVSRGDTVNYSITLTNAGTSPAYDLSLADVLPAGLAYVPNTTTLTVGGVTTSFASPNAVTFAMLGSGQTGVVNYQVMVDPAVAAAASYTNTATVSFDSLSGPGGRAATASGTATISTPTDVIGLSKSIVSTTIPDTGTAQFRPGVTDLNVGEHAVIDLTASFTEGTTATVVLTDQLPLTGKFQLVGTPTITFLGGTTSTLPGTATLIDTDGDGLADKITFNFGTVTVPVDGDPTNNLIRIRYEIVTPDVATNVAGAALSSPALLTTAAGNASASILADIVAPNVGITKAVSAGSADAGDVKAYTVTIANNGSGPAFDLTIADTLPAGLTAVSGTTVLTVGGVSTSFASPASIPIASLGVGQSAVLTFNAVVGDGVVAGSTLTNGASVSYDSLAGPGGHPGSAATTASFATAAVQTLDKTIVATSEAFTDTQYVRPTVTDLTIGERATFELATTFSEGTTNNVVITDQLVTANGVLTYAGTPTLILGSGITITGSVTPQLIDTNGDGVPDQVRFNLGTVTVPGNNIATDNFVRIRYDATVANVATNASGNQVALPAVLMSSTGALTATAPADIVAPSLTIAKILAPDQPTDGQHTDFLITVGHATGSTAAATNLVLTEMLPPGALLSGAVVVSGPAGIVISGNVITIPLLRVGETVTVRITTALDFANTPTGDTINTASVAFGTTTAGPPGGRTISGITSSAILPFGNPTTTLPGMLDRQEQQEFNSMGSYLDARFIEDFPEIDPVYSGSAAPGTSITIDVSDNNGSLSGLGTGSADAGGNWLVRLPSTTVSDRLERSRFDHYYDGSRLFRSPNGELFDTRSLLGFSRLGDRLSVGSQPSQATQVVRISVGGQSSGFDTSFAPAWRDQFFSMEPGLSVGGVFRDRAGNAVEGLYEGLASPEAAGLNRFNREFLTTADF